VRNPDLITASSLLTTGTYQRLPSDINESFIPKPPLTNGSILDTLRRLDAHILYRLRCVDYVPPDITIDKITDGRAYIAGGNGSWRAELTMTGFGNDAQSRWWLTGLQWIWRSRTDEKGKAKSGKRFKGMERQGIMDLVNREILPPEDSGQAQSGQDVALDGDAGKHIAVDTPVVSAGALDVKPKSIDAPLVRLVNCISEYRVSRTLTWANRQITFP
jgi:mediator of RNA polymerase II transcription subunit 14